MNDKMQCMIRMDDITADMEWDKFYQVKEVFDRYNIRPLLGIVPENRDDKLSVDNPKEDFWEFIRSAQQEGWSVAQHGTHHQYITENSGILGLKKASEFAGLSYEEQYAKLEKGKIILEEHGVYSDIFMAPGHTFDKNTLKALYKLGFRVITDGLYKKPYYFENMLCIPCRLEKYSKIKGIDTICLHSNHMSEADIKELERFCERHRENIIPFDVTVLEEWAVKKNFLVGLTEKVVLYRRRFKNVIANSERLTWYFQYTNDTSNKKKWIKRVIYLPFIFIGRKERK